MTVSRRVSLKNSFRFFFEGYSFDYEDCLEPVISIPIYKFEIHDIECFEFDNEIAMRIKLGRPGILIGKAGSTIDTLKKYLTTHMGKNVNIYIEESKMWTT